MKPDGKYIGTIHAVDYEKDSFNEDGLVLCFDITLDDGTQVRAKQATHGPYAHICKDLIEELELEWPKGVAKIAEAIGRTVGVKLKTRTISQGKSFQNAYIISGQGGGEPAKEADINKTLRALGAETDDDIPF